MLAQPPPAYLLVGTHRFRLAQESYCWGRVCADYIPAHCDDGRTPTIRLRSGALVRIALAYPALEVTAAFGEPPRVRSAKLDPVRPEFRVRRSGLFGVFTRARSGDSSYAACIRVR